MKKIKKQGGSRTYKGYDGYAPIMAYIGMEGYLVNCELREGKQHCQKHTSEFLRETIRMCREITDEPLLIRLGSRNDAAENIGILVEAGCHFIFRRLPIVTIVLPGNHKNNQGESMPFFRFSSIPNRHLEPKSIINH